MSLVRTVKKEEVTSRERVQRAFSRREADRVPVNYLANPGIDTRLKKHFGLKADDNLGLMNELGVDFFGVEPTYTGPEIHPQIPDRSVHKLWGTHCRWIEHQSGGYWDYCDFPMRDADMEAVERWPLPNPDDFNYKGVNEKCRKYKNYALFYGDAGLGDIMNGMGMLFGTERVYIAMADPDDALMRLIDRKIEVQLGIMRRALEASDGNYTFVWMGEDLGTQRGPLISLSSYREIIKPRHQRFVDLAKSYGLPVMLHSCGSSSWAFNDMAEMGIDVVDTLQPEAANMSPEYLKSTYSSKLAFHGCISTAGPLSFGTETEVIENVRNTLDVMMPGGGYSMAPTQLIQDNSPTENVIALYKATHQYGWYI